MSGDASHHPCILVVHFALDDPLAKSFVLDSRWYELAQLFCRAKSRRSHAQRREDLPPTKRVQSLTGNPLQGHAKNDESDIAVLNLRARIVFQRRIKRE